MSFAIDIDTYNDTEGFGVTIVVSNPDADTGTWPHFTNAYGQAAYGQAVYADTLAGAVSLAGWQVWAMFHVLNVDRCTVNRLNREGVALSPGRTVWRGAGSPLVLTNEILAAVADLHGTVTA